MTRVTPGESAREPRRPESDFGEDQEPVDFRDREGPTDFRDREGPTDFRDRQGPLDFDDFADEDEIDRGDQAEKDR